jgi:hypothetical protein
MFNTGLNFAKNHWVLTLLLVLFVLFAFRPASGSRTTVGGRRVRQNPATGEWEYE